MESPYNSSFESEEDEEVQIKKETITISRNPSADSKLVVKNELEVLCKGVSDLPTLNTNTDTQAHANKSWIYETASKYISQSRMQNFAMQKQPPKPQNEQRRNFLKPVLSLTRSVSSFKGSASINRRKKLQQIEHDNLILLKKLQNVKPSSEVTEWKKHNKRANSALPNRMARNTSRVERPAT